MPHLHVIDEDATRAAHEARLENSLSRNGNANRAAHEAWREKMRSIIPTHPRTWQNKAFLGGAGEGLPGVGKMSPFAKGLFSPQKGR